APATPAAPAAEPAPQVQPMTVAIPQGAPPPIVSPTPAQPTAVPAAQTSPPPAAAPAQPHVFGSTTPGPIVIRATADTWMEMLDNNVSVWSRLMHAGDVYNVPKDGLVLRTGNAGGVEISVNGKVLPPLGPSGQVRRLALDTGKLSGG